MITSTLARKVRPLPLHCKGFIGAEAALRRASSRNTRSQNATYGFIGLGAMGMPMARNLRSKIHKNDKLVLYDVNTQATKQFVRETSDDQSYVHVVQSAAEVAKLADTVITVLPEPSHVRAVYDTFSAAEESSPKTERHRLFIDCSTIDPITSRAVAKMIEEKLLGKAALIDAPMSGGVVGARAGKLTFMLGSSPQHVTRATSVLSLMGSRVVHLGPQGSGLSGKLANNYLLALNNIATCEAMSLGIKCGLDARALADMINSATGRCWPSEVNNPVPGVVDGAPAGREYEGGFGISLMRKDLGLALESAQEYGVKIGLGEHAMAMYRAAEQDVKCKGKDFSSMYRWLDGPDNNVTK